MEKLSISEVKKIVCDRLDVKTTNISLNARMGKNMIKVYVGFLRNVLNDQPLYSFVPKESTKISKGEWEYDVSSFKIYKIDKDSLKNSSFDIDAFKEFSDSEMVNIYLNDNLLVYDSNKGVHTVDIGATERKLTAREYACLILELPDSGTKWLDDLIIKKHRNKLLNV